jgi:predicted dehydrogenase
MGGGASLRKTCIPGGARRKDAAPCFRLPGRTPRAGVPTAPGAYPAFSAAVAESLRTGAPPPVDAMDAVAGLEIIHAAQRWAEQGNVIRL